MIYKEENKMILRGKVKTGLGNAKIWVNKAKKILEEKYRHKGIFRNIKYRIKRKLYFKRRRKNFTTRIWRKLYCICTRM